MVFTPKPQFRGRKLVFKIYFLPSQTHLNVKPNSLPLHHPSPTIGGSRVLRRAVSSKSILKERKTKLALSFKKQTLLKGTVNKRIFQLASKRLLLPKASKGPQAKTSMCTSTNPPPFKPKDGFPVFKNLEQLWFSSATNLKYKHTCAHKYTRVRSVPKNKCHSGLCQGYILMKVRFLETCPDL